MIYVGVGGALVYEALVQWKHGFCEFLDFELLAQSRRLGERHAQQMMWSAKWIRRWNTPRG